MPRFFVDEVNEDYTVITGEDAKHIARALRVQKGEILTLCDKNGMVYSCEVVALGDTVELRVLESYESAAEPSARVHLFQALPKGDKMELIIQKAVELGVTEITPVLTRRCISRPDAKAAQKKLLRWNKIAAEAAKQAGRAMIPTALPMQNFAEAITMMKQSQVGILFYENDGKPLGQLVPQDAQSISVMVGSEGGFDEAEVAAAQEQGVEIATLGKRILRCETAPIAGLAIIMHLTGNI